MHAENVSLVRNLSTGYLSPQFHVVHDDWFETCYSSADQIPPQWEDMCIFDRFETVFDKFDKEGLLIPPPPLADEWLSPEELATCDKGEFSTKTSMSRTKKSRKISSMILLLQIPFLLKS